MLTRQIIDAVVGAALVEDAPWGDLTSELLIPAAATATARLSAREPGTFAGGAVFGYSQILPAMFAFFTSYDSELVQSAWSMHEVLKLTTRMFLAFGVAFELPVFVFFLAVAGIVEPRDLLRGTRYAVLVIFVVAAVLTPSPDWVSQVMLGVPMVVLYLVGVAVAFAFGPRRERAEPTSLPATRPAASRDPGSTG